MSQTPDKQQSEPDSPQPAVKVEPDTPPMVTITKWLAILMFLVVVVVIGLWQLFKQTVRQQIHDKDLSVESRELAELRAKDHARLTRYARLDEAGKQYQIPIERAMAKLLANQDLVRSIPTLAKPPESRPAAASQPAGANEALDNTEKPQQRSPNGQPRPGAPAPTDQK